MARKVFNRRPNLVAEVEAQPGPVVIKWFGWRHPIHLYLSPTFPGRAWTSWEVARALGKAAARTPSPIYVYTRRRRGFILENFFITECINPHQTLRALLKSDASSQMMYKAVKDLAFSIARMHRGGIQHRDLTTANFLVDKSGRVFIVDLNRARLRPHLSYRQRLIDLARLNFAARDSELEEDLTRRFFQIYGAETGTAADWEKGYRDYRRRLLKLKGRKNRLRRAIRRK